MSTSYDIKIWAINEDGSRATEGVLLGKEIMQGHEDRDELWAEPDGNPEDVAHEVFADNSIYIEDDYPHGWEAEWVKVEPWGTASASSPNLYDYETAELIGPATAEQVKASAAADAKNQNGVFLIDADGTPVDDGSWAAQQPGVRTVYTL